MLMKTESFRQDFVRQTKILRLGQKLSTQLLKIVLG